MPFTLSGSAAQGADYTITASPITILAGATTGSATIAITSDTLHELGGETVILTMGTPSNATLATTTVHTATIKDDDNIFPVVGAGLDQTVTLRADAPPPWSPAIISPAAWYDASDSATITQSGGAISAILDKSGNGRHATQATTTRQPTLSTWQGRSAIQIVRTGTSGDLLATSTNPIADADDFTIVSAMEGTKIGRGADGSGSGWSINHGSTGCSVVLISGGVAAYNSPVFPAGSRLQTSVLDQIGTSSVLYYGNNGANLGSVNAPKVTLRTSTRLLELGSANGSATAGYIGEVVILNRVLETSDRQKLEGYLAHKWVTSASLPAGHPYKAAAPIASGLGAVANLTGSASDADNDPLTTTWSIISGPNGANIGNPVPLSNTATFTQTGVYTLRLTVSDGYSTVYDDLSVTVGPATDYETWAVIYPGMDLSNPNADADGDGMSNRMESIFGLNPTSPISNNPISAQLDATTGTFSYTRRDPALNGLVYSVWSSLDLVTWNQDNAAQQNAAPPDANGVQGVVVTVSPTLLENPKLFVRIRAE